MNCAVLLIGAMLVMLGVYVQEEKTFHLSVQSVISNPAIILIIAGSILVTLGVCGSIGALLEVYLLLVLYSAVLGVVALLQIAALGLLVVKKDIINAAVTKTVNIYILQYYNDPDTQNIVDAVQTTLQCCGSTKLKLANLTTSLPAPHSWETNPYFNCSSLAYQKCSVPYTCCMPESGNLTVINLQCGYGRLHQAAYLLNIYTTGCVDAFEELVTKGKNNQIIMGVASVIILIQVINSAIAISVASTVRRGRKALKLIKKQGKEMEKRLNAVDLKNCTV